MRVIIKEISNTKNEVEKVKKFLFNQINEEYGYGYIEEYHKDIKNLKEYYIMPERANFFIAKDCETGKIIGTIAIREYDKDFKEFKDLYTKKSTASIWRLFIDKKYRRNKIATKLVNIVESFSSSQNYREIYLHTQKNLNGAVEFWKNLGYEISLDTNNKLKTVHMIKPIFNLKPHNDSYEISIKS